MTTLWAGWSRFDSCQGRGRDLFFSSSLRPDRFGGPPSGAYLSTGTTLPLP